MPYINDEGTKGVDIKIQWNGFREFEDLLSEIEDDFGERDAKKILQNAMRDAMKPALVTARNLLTENDNINTGQLINSLHIEARKPTPKDKHSKYSSPTMIMIARLTVAPGHKFVPDDDGQKRLLSKQFKNKLTGKKEHMHSDARAWAIEFGTARWRKGEGMPFIRPALESNAVKITDSLADSLKNALLKYKSRHMTIGK